MGITLKASFCAFSVSVICGIAAAPVSTSAVSTEAPNIVVILSDDQPYYSVEEMPYVSALDGLEPLGTLYDNVALCCPARASFLSGLYSHHTGVELNTHADRFDPSKTLATWLDAEGYETGLFGKYLNGYPFGEGEGGVPPGWDRWVAFAGPEPQPSYYDYDLNSDGNVRRYGDGPRDYSTDVLARKAEAFVKSAPEPFFALVTPIGPHSPWLPAPRHEGLYRGVPFPVRPNFGEAAQGAPFFYKQFPSSSLHEQQTRWRRQMETLRSVDDLTRTVLTAADERPGETVVLYLSDNGFSLGSHRWPSKRCGYEECGRLAGLMRSPGDPSGVLASIVDLAPTLADLAGAPRTPTDGQSFVPQLRGEAGSSESAILLRHRSDPGQNNFGRDLPGFWGLRTQRWKYLRHGFGAGAEGEPGRPEELYDLNADPFELSNLAHDPTYVSVLEELRARLKLERSTPPR